MKIGIEIATSRPVKILDQNNYLYLIAYIDSQTQKELHPNAIAWVGHKNIELKS